MFQSKTLLNVILGKTCIWKERCLNLDSKLSNCVFKKVIFIAFVAVEWFNNDVCSWIHTKDVCTMRRVLTLQTKCHHSKYVSPSSASCVLILHWEIFFGYHLTCSQWIYDALCLIPCALCTQWMANEKREGKKEKKKCATTVLLNGKHP